MDKAVDDDVAQSSRGVMSIAFHDDVFTSLDLSFAARATGKKVREESLSVFSNRGVSSSHASEAGI